MADVLEISESNGAGQTVTDGITNGNFGSTDAANLTTATYPIRAGENSYIKYHRLHWKTKDAYTKIDNVKIYKSAGTLSGSDALVHKADATYATPVATALADSTAIPTTSGTATAITCSLTDVGYSSYCALQLQVDAATTAGATGITLTWLYDAQA